MRKETLKTIELMKHLSNRKQYVLDTLQSIEDHGNTFDMIKKKEKEKSPISWPEKIILKIVFNKLIKKIESMELKGSWRTSLVGWLTLLGTFVVSAAIPLLDGNPSTSLDMNAIIQALANAGVVVPVWLIGLLSRDKGVSSEEQRAASKK